MENSGDTVGEAQWLRAQIDESIEKVRHRKEVNKVKASAIRVATILLSGLIPILLGLPIEEYQTVLKGIALICGASITMLNAMEPFFSYRALWIAHEEAEARFYSLRDELDFYLSGSNQANTIETDVIKFQEKYLSIWNHLSNQWLHHRKKEHTITHQNTE